MFDDELDDFAGALTLAVAGETVRHDAVGEHRNRQAFDIIGNHEITFLSECQALSRSIQRERSAGRNAQCQVI